MAEAAVDSARIVGLTGGIASGKSTVSSMLRELGAYVVDADVWARRVVEPGSDGLSEIVSAFGSDILMPDGTLNRPRLATIIFHDASQRDVLNRITHPRVREGMLAETAAYASQKPGQPVIWDVPLLFEGETHHLVGATILVYVPLHVQKERLMARNQLTEAEALARIAAQMPLDDKRSLATYVIDNSQSLEFTREQVQRIWQMVGGQKELRGGRAKQ